MRLRTWIPVGALLLLSGTAHAQLVLTLTPNPALGVQNSALTITARLQNTGNATLDLNGGSGSVSGPGSATDVMWDDTQFLNGLPFTLAGLDFYQNTLLLNVAQNAVLGDYSATYTVEGADLAGTPLFGSNTITATVNAAAGNSVPEPGLSALFSAGCGAAGLFAVRRRRNLLKTT